MAVKKHELVADNRNQLDLKALQKYIQLMNEQPNFLPPPYELVKVCQDIVKCLGEYSLSFFEAVPSCIYDNVLTSCLFLIETLQLEHLALKMNYGPYCKMLKSSFCVV